MTKTPPSFDLWYQDFRDGCRRLTLEEIGAFILLLIEQFEVETLPRNRRDLEVICSTQSQHCDAKRFDAIWESLKSKFEETDDGFQNAKMAEIREKTFKRWHSNRKNALKGGRPKKNPSVNPSVSGKTRFAETQVEGEVEVEDRSKKKKKRSVAPNYTESFESFWAVFPKAGKTRKADAFKYWDRLEAMDQIEAAEAAPEYGLSEIVRKGFCMCAANWLRDRCWEDDRSAWNRSSETKQKSIEEQVRDAEW